MQGWRHAEGQLATIFFNDSSGAYFEIWNVLDPHVTFGIGSGQDELQFQDDLTMKPKKILSTSSNLLSTLKAGQGKDAIFDRMMTWTAIREGPLITLKSDLKPGNRIVLTSDSFVYFCPKGALIVSSSVVKLTRIDEAERFLKLLTDYDNPSSNSNQIQVGGSLISA